MHEVPRARFEAVKNLKVAIRHAQPALQKLVLLQLADAHRQECLCHQFFFESKHNTKRRAVGLRRPTLQRREDRWARATQPGNI
jgi:hypothetical protein